MSEHEVRDNLMERLARGFQDTHLGTSQHKGIPFVPNETAQSHFFRMIDFLNPEIWEDASTYDISKEAILTLLQCAARLYESGIHAKEAVDLIESKDTRAILGLGIQGNLSQLIYRRCVESIVPNKFKATNAENCSQQAGLISAIQKTKAQRLNHQAMIIKHIVSLCRSHGTVLQNTFESPMIDELFMFHNYITLSRAFNLREKSWLVTLFPDIFQWQSQGSCGGISKCKLISPPSHNSVIISKELEDQIILSTYKDIKEAFYYIDLSRGPLWIADRDMQFWLGNAIAKESSELLKTYNDWRVQHQHSDSKLSTNTNKVQEFEKWAEFLYRLASVEAITSVLNTAKGLRGQTIYQKENSMSTSKEIENNIPDPDWYALESDNDIEGFFPYSPDACNSVSNSKSASTPPPHETNMSGKALHSCATFTKDIQSAFTLVGPSNGFLEIAELPTILEEPQE